MEDLSNIKPVTAETVSDRQRLFRTVTPRSEVKIGRYVKIPFEEMDGERTLREHMWVEITQDANGEFIGRLDNDPLILTNVKFNDIVTVDFDQIEQML